MSNKGKNSKTPKTSFDPKQTKKAIHTKNPEGYQNQFIAWHFECMDDSGSWPCSISVLHEIKNRLHEYEKLKWFDLRGSSHPLPVNKIIPKAQRRLIDLGLNDYETLYQLEIKNGHGRQRLWGLRVENIFKILWWDPEHEVYPVEKRNT
jgi:hypothetical protein